MECRPKFYRVGDTVRTAGGYPYVLPAGLDEGAAVRVVRIDAPRVFVCDSGGREWDLFLTNIDSGMEYWKNGRWVSIA